MPCHNLIRIFALFGFYVVFGHLLCIIFCENAYWQRLSYLFSSKPTTEKEKLEEYFRFSIWKKMMVRTSPKSHS